MAVENIELELICKQGGVKLLTHEAYVKPHHASSIK